ncbi:virulence factor SrfB [Succinivibrio sp.]|uniref:virulence factor SrfB n=1 Tax=Succinivibrio sp. TaxID=2053619 RepID=UPI003866A366
MADVFVDIVKSIKTSKDEENKTIKLVANSGIQFIDFEFDGLIDFESDDKDIYPKHIVKGQFVKHPKYADHYARFREDKLNECLRVDDFETAINIGSEYRTEEDRDDTGVSMLDSLHLYNGVWFPIPYFSKNKNDTPVNWARARIINKSDVKKRETGGEYHVTFAFDTNVIDHDDPFKCVPSEQQINDVFTFRGGIEATAMLLGSSDGTSFVEEWARSVYDKLFDKTYFKKGKERIKKDWLDKRFYEKHYLNLIAFLEHFVRPNDIKLMPFSEKSTNTPTPVSLILDIGNTRSLGFLVEDDDSDSCDLKSNPQLEIRDLNAVENLYKGNFDSKVQFQKAVFDFNSSSSTVSSLSESFVWPSLVRVGKEAVNLAANAKGNEGRTGLISPKRYLWQLEHKDPDHVEEWSFNSNYYQIPMYCQKADDPDSYEEKLYNVETFEKTAVYAPVSEYLNSSGDALFADTSNNSDDSHMKALYTGKSMMTLMLVEVILQAQMQINSYHYRHRKQREDSPRFLKSIVLTTPPAMSDLEKEVFRSCVYQAIGIVWKARGFDKTPPREFAFITKANQMFPMPPEVKLDFSETMAGQLVYFHNETQRVFNGNSLDFISHIRRDDADGRYNEYAPLKFAEKRADYKTARIATIDIGGGTTDLVITDYSAPYRVYKDMDNKESGSSEVSNQQGVVQIREVLKDGNKVAGDDLVHDIICDEIIPKLKDSFELKNIIGSDKEAGNALSKQKRVQCVEQIFTRIAYRILSRIEQLSKAPIEITSIVTKGSINDFLKNTDVCPVLDAVFDKTDNGFEVDSSVKEYVKNGLGVNDFFDTKLEFDIYRINRKLFHNSSNSLSNTLDYLNTIVNAYRCDVLLLTGRASKLPGIRRLIESKSYLSAKRIISMHSYDCSSWYPTFSLNDGKIGDPKTSVVVGAAIGYIKTSNVNNLINFRINPKYMQAPSAARYMGTIDEKSELKKDSVKFRFKTNAEIAVYGDAETNKDPTVNNEDKDEVIKKFTSDDANLIKLINLKDEVFSRQFTIKIPVNLGYRQFAEPLFTANPLYSIELVTSVKQLKSITDNKKLFAPEYSQISFDEQGYQSLKDNFINKLIKSVREKADEKYLSAKNSIDAISSQYAQAKEYAMSGSSNIQMASLDVSNPFYETAMDFINMAKNAGSNAQSQIKQTGFMAKLTNAQSKAQGAFDAAYDEFVKANESLLDDKLASLYSDLKNDIAYQLSRELSSFLGESNTAKKENETKELESITNEVNAHARQFKFKITLDENPINSDSAVGRSIDFVYRELDEKNKPVLNLLKIDEAEIVDSDFTGNVEDYVTIKLKTVSYDGDYWNNSGLLLK